MAFDLFARFLEIAGQSAGRCCQQPEQKKSNTVGAHAADFRLSRYHHQINRVESGKKQASGYTGGKKGCQSTAITRCMTGISALPRSMVGLIAAFMVFAPGAD